MLYGKLDERLAAPPPSGTGRVDIDGDLLKGEFESNSIYMLGVNVSFRF